MDSNDLHAQPLTTTLPHTHNVHTYTYLPVSASTTFTFEPAGADTLAGHPPRDPKARALMHIYVYHMYVYIYDTPHTDSSITQAPFFDPPMLTGIAAGAASLFSIVLLSGSIAWLHPYYAHPAVAASLHGPCVPVLQWTACTHAYQHPRPTDAAAIERAYFQSLCFAGWLVGHVLLALHMRTADQPVLLKVSVFTHICMCVCMCVCLSRLL